jgi:hypothetical protein
MDPNTNFDEVSIAARLGRELLDYNIEVYGNIREKLDAMKEQLPEKPFIVSEFGKWTVPGIKTPYPPGEGYQAAKLTNEWRRFSEEKGFVGGFVWCFVDYNVHLCFRWVHEYRVAYGLFDLRRRPKEAAFALKEIWDTE